MISLSLVLTLLVSLLVFALFELEHESMFPFYLPWDDSTPSSTNISTWIDKPAGKYGYVYVGPDGHLYVGNKRIRFLGVNLCFGACFPRKEDSEKIAARMAKFGINIVRFHHMDHNRFPNGILARNYKDTRHLDPEALDRLDYFVAKLKENGIYVDLNLLVSRRFTSADGLPKEIDQMDWKDQHVLGYFYEPVRELQKEYARQLLLHKNPYTGMTYAEDPAVAFVEIINEHGLIHSWLGGVIDKLPNIFKEELKRKWNEYLKEKYGTSENLLKVWGTGYIGDELITNGDFRRGLTGWSTEVHGDAKAYYEIVEGSNDTKVLKVRVTRKGSEGWYVQFNYPNINVVARKNYILKFMARANKNVKITILLQQAHDPWGVLSNTVEVELTTEWKSYEVILYAHTGDSNARLSITGLGAYEATYEFTKFSLREFEGFSLLEDENLENLSIRLFTRDEYLRRSCVAKRDWMEYLWKLEEDYYLEMCNYLKNELGVKALIIGTIVGCGTPNILAKLDVIDTHAYWHHPVFPGRPWDPENWYVVNEPMVNHMDEGTIPHLALKRVYGKPHTVSEYNHPMPNMYDAEAFIELAAYAALQDWDGIFAFAYSHRTDDWDTKGVRGYFDIDQHPIKMATLIIAHAIFVRGDIEPARKLVVAELRPEDELYILISGKAHAWRLPDGSYVGIPPKAALIHRTAIVVGNTTVPKEALKPSDLYFKETNIYSSDNGQVIWDISIPSKGILLINSSRTVAVVGFGGGRTFNFGSVTIKPEKTGLNGWCVVALTTMDGKNFQKTKRILIIAGGRTMNTDMRLRQMDNKLTCGRDWGKAPSLVEGISAMIKLKVRGSVEVWALDNTGSRAEKVPVKIENGHAVFKIDPRWKTIWYEVVIKGD